MFFDAIIASGKPIQTINIPAAMAAPDQENGRADIFDKGTTTRFIIVHTNKPYNTVVKKILIERNFSLG